MKKNFLKLLQVHSIRIGLASSDQVRQWAERILPNGKTVGQILNSQTVNYKTLKPEKGGLFCERIFGPVNNFECACGKKKQKFTPKFCTECNVEFTSSRVRRHRLGYIKLMAPVTHIWYLKGRPSYISILLDMPKKQIEAITYCTEFFNYSYEKHYTQSGTLFLLFKKHQNFFYFSNQTASWEIQEDWTFFVHYITAPIEKKDIPLQFNEKKKAQNHYPIQQIGAEAIRDLLSNLNFAALERELRIQLFFINEDVVDLQNELKIVENQGYLLCKEEQKKLKKFLYKQLKLLIYSRLKKVRRLKLITQFRRTKTRPEWMIISILPVLPPDLRPIIQLEGEQVAVSDLNKLYQKVLFRNNRIKINSGIKSDEIKYAQRLLQEAVDGLIENGKGGAKPICTGNERPLKSLSDILKGKKGRFRQNLLGKRVDYSGRSVIVVGPHLQIYECGLPKELAIELFQPFLIKSLMAKKVIRTIVGAKKLIQQQNPVIWKILEQVIQNHPILLNRAPTLHRVGFQAFQPKLVEGRAILLHPLVCTAFNADFDGDQMAVHIPLSFEARAEAWTLMWSRNNLLSTATGQPLVLPSQDMVLGCYFLTTNNFQINNKKNNHFTIFSNFQNALKFYNYHNISNHTFIWVRCNNFFETNSEKEKPIEIQLQTGGSFMVIYSQHHKNVDANNFKSNQYIRTTPGRIIINHLIQEICYN